MCDLREAHAKKYISRLPCYNSIFRYFEDEVLTPHLQLLIEESALPLQVLESSFAVDSSGFSTSKFVQWVQAKHHDPKLLEARDWVKVHLMCGVKTNVITAIEVTHAHASDHKYFVPLVEATSQNFVMDSVAADKAYSSYRNTQFTMSKAAIPYIDFKKHTKMSARTPSAWRRMFHLYSYNQEEFMRHYHKRSNVESVFSAVKRKLGPSVRAKTLPAQINEVLLKCLAYNLTVLVHAIHELRIDPAFWSRLEVH